MNLFEMKQEREAHLRKAEEILASAKLQRRELSETETLAIDHCTAQANELTAKIDPIEAKNTIRNANPMDVLMGRAAVPSAAVRAPQPMSKSYNEAFLSFLRTGGKHMTAELGEGLDPIFGGYALPALPRMSAALYEGSGGSSNGAGGYAVSVPTDYQIVPLGLPDLGVRSVARVIPTATDIKIPQQASFGTAGIKLESGSSSNQFSESDPSLSQFTLSAFMVGLTHTVSWELMQDVQLFSEFAVQDLLNAVAIFEDSAFVTGSGSGQPQGLLGNTGTGTGAAYAVDDTGQYLLDSTLDVLGTLKATYFSTSAWLMSRSTATAIRKAQLQSNLFAPVWTRENGRDLLHGFPVVYSSSMPSLPTSTTAGVTPILFGSFNAGYLIGDRGGAGGGTFVKVLDQPLATSGQTILLAYKRTDGRVRRSEAIQAISVSHA